MSADDPRGGLLNDRGDAALKNGLEREALELFRLAVRAFREGDDPDGEVVATENQVLAFISMGRLGDAFDALEPLPDALARTGSEARLAEYAAEMRTALAEAGRSRLRRRRAPEADPDLVGVLVAASRERRERLVDRFERAAAEAR